MKDIFEFIVVIVAALLLIAGVIALSGLFWYLVGSFIIYVFNIGITWTYLHGLATALVMTLLSGTIKVSVNKED